MKCRTVLFIEEFLLITVHCAEYPALCLTRNKDRSSDQEQHVRGSEGFVCQKILPACRHKKVKRNNFLES